MPETEGQPARGPSPGDAQAGNNPDRGGKQGGVLGRDFIRTHRCEPRHGAAGNPADTADGRRRDADPEARTACSFSFPWSLPSAFVASTLLPARIRIMPPEAALCCRLVSKLGIALSYQGNSNFRFEENTYVLCLDLWRW